MNEFMLWFMRPIAETLGAMAMVFGFGLILLAMFYIYHFYTLARKWLKSKLKKKND